MAGAGWSVYLIVSTQLPRSYVGVTTHFPRRLKQHNGELKGGAKACRAGRPWTCACIIHGFKDQSEVLQITVLFVASEFEWKWKRLSRKLQRGKAAGVEEKRGVCEEILGNRELALKKVRDSCPSSHLEVDWKITSQTYRISTC